ncbi:MAG: hypothetical protein QOJ07_3948, partial [Thermoleophilaceae bacterium]|nr:hypothetical protein [Thermoleophilaceae bacterium]
AAGVATIAAVWAPGASADTFCVADPGCVAGGGSAAASVPDAVTAAAGSAGRDRIQIGPGTFAGGYADVGNQVDIVGAGRDRTTLTQDPANPHDALAANDPSSTVRDLAISIPAGDNNAGLVIGGTAEHLTITGTGSGILQHGIDMVDGSAVVRDGQVTTAATANSTGIHTGTGGAYAIEDVTTSGGGGIETRGATVIRRARIVTQTVGVLGGSFDLYDSTIELRPGGAGPPTGISVYSGGHGLDFAGNVRNVTVAGTGQAGSVGLLSDAETESPPSGSSALDVSDSIVWGVDVARRRGPLHSAPANLTTDHSDFDPAHDTSGSGPGTLSPFDGNGNITADPRFVGPPGGNLALRYDSPAVDAGTPGDLGAGEPATDLGGHPRRVDGNGDGAAVRDMGAFEYGRGAPTAVASVGPAGSATGPGAPFRFLAGGSGDPDGEALTYAWAFDDGGAASGDTAEHAFATAGPHSGTLTVTDPTGQSATATASFTVSAPPPVPPPAPTDHGRCGNKLAGTPTGDLLTGSRFGDRIDGGAGDDVIGGQGGSDCLNGGAGRDRIGGGTGHDSLTGGAGNDVMGGENGNDSVSGGSGNDILDGDAGNDRLSGGSGNDSLDGGAGRNVLSGGKGNDWIYAQNGVRDVIDCGPGRDHADVDKHLDKFKNCEHVRRLS